MNFRFVVSFLIALVSFYAVAEPISFKREKLVAVLNAAATDEDFKELPLFVTYPSGFIVEKRDVRALGTLFIRSPSSDIDGFINGTAEESLGGGFFMIALSLNVGYVPGSGKFTGEDDLQTKAKMERTGVKNIVSRRRDKNGVPIYETTAEGPNGRHIYIAYIAIGNSGSAFRVMYYHPKSHTERDVSVWRAFVDGLGGE